MQNPKLSLVFKVYLYLNIYVGKVSKQDELGWLPFDFSIIHVLIHQIGFLTTFNLVSCETRQTLYLRIPMGQKYF